MKLKLTAVIFLCLTLFSAGCKKFLTVQPIDKLSGNAYWKTTADVESFVSDIYGQFRDKLQTTSFIGASGELRSGQVKMSPETDHNFRGYIDMAGQNNLLGLIAPNASWNNNAFNFGAMTQWKDFYRVVQSANILEKEISRNHIPELSTQDVRQYEAEAVFIRCLTYLFLVRLYGDVPYYTEAYLSTPLPRMDMVTVLNNCIVELDKVKDDLPWTYKDPAKKGVRATKGGALALLMYMNLWNAGFDKGKKQDYFAKTVAYGKEMIQSGSYKLLSIDESHLIFKGRTDESLVEIAQNFNYNEVLTNYAPFQDMLLHFPYKGTTYSFGYYRAAFLHMLYPDGQADRRRDVWFDQSMFADNGQFQFIKFTNSFVYSNTSSNPDDNIIVFRYATALLMTAEAMVETGQTNEATGLLNMVRKRAGAPMYSGPGGDDLRQAIYLEQAKELMGEGIFYFDLVRTGRVMDQKWCFTPLTADQFARGGWTWPLNPSVMDNNPLMKLNNYWIN